ncbi:Sigma factor RpoE regulatory protein RseC [Rhodovulum sp. P5]|uniref:SoxR reducing system RseC family protein n=1 Tax=Rhodovulum sp. P5 TaxID=1564506 RepID=UPI0009C2142D|nr:SoxR reducing system RseC family protein [Rhodovulum sp. P5]ARE40193.1 Sigma factor RpoE regulatory protein RseC [Rhodovulum sp. P5]
MSDERDTCLSPADPGEGRALRQKLRVADVDEAVVRLEANRMAGCAHCAARAGCGTGALAEMAGGGLLEIALPRTGAVAPGDEVIVSFSGNAFLGAAGLAYLLPPAALVLAAGLFSALGLSDLVVALSCIPVLALSFLPLRLADRRGRIAAAMRIEEVVPAHPRGGA